MIFRILWLFLVYSFAGWVLEVSVAAIHQKKFVNRGIINSPFCIIFGVGGCLITVFFGELTGIWLFLAGMLTASLTEWTAGHIIEKMYHEKWWDYQKIKWNLDGYISLPTSCVWGLLGVFTVRAGNRFLFWIYDALPELIMQLIVIGFMALLVVDAFATVFILSGVSKNPDRWKHTDAQMESVSRKLMENIYRLIERRINKAYPKKKKIEREVADTTIFAYGCSFYKIVLLFFTGAFLGDVTETIFCRISAGVWMSRSSVVWGDFSIVWGLAIAAVTMLLYRYRNRSDSFLFFFGFFLGGAYEYICSVFTELVFGTVFWDYSRMPFNLGGRINLLYCFFWGIAAVVWFKRLYPFFSGLIEKIPKRAGKCITWFLIVFMAADIVMSCAALERYQARNAGQEAQTKVEEWLDTHFDDARMEAVYPNAMLVEK